MTCTIPVSNMNIARGKKKNQNLRGENLHHNLSILEHKNSSSLWTNIYSAFLKTEIYLTYWFLVYNIITQYL